jgi:hypothetical protein
MGSNNGVLKKIELTLCYCGFLQQRGRISHLAGCGQDVARGREWEELQKDKTSFDMSAQELLE